MTGKRWAVSLSLAHSVKPSLGQRTPWDYEKATFYISEHVLESAVTFLSVLLTWLLCSKSIIVRSVQRSQKPNNAKISPRLPDKSICHTTQNSLANDSNSSKRCRNFFLARAENKLAIPPSTSLKDDSNNCCNIVNV